MKSGHGGKAAQTKPRMESTISDVAPPENAPNWAIDASYHAATTSQDRSAQVNNDSVQGGSGTQTLSGFVTGTSNTRCRQLNATSVVEELDNYD